MIGSQTWRLADLGAKHMLLKKGIGWGYMPEPMVCEDLETGRLVQLDMAEYKDGFLRLYAIHRTDTPPGPAGSWLIARLRAQANGPAEAVNRRPIRSVPAIGAKDQQARSERLFAERWVPVMAKSTRATLALKKVGINFKLHRYDYDPDAERIGLHAAEAIGIEPRRLLKTLMAEVDGKPVCVVVPSDREVSMKKLAAAFGGKTAKMMHRADAERLTGYHIGGISPFAQKKRVSVAIDEAALSESTIFLNGGQRGMQIELAPDDARKALDAIVLSLTA